MIIIAEGYYEESQLTIDKNNISISGNWTDPGVRVGSSLSGPSVYVDGVFNVSIEHINFTSSSFQAMRVINSENLHLGGCVFWSGGGMSGALSIEKSVNISIASDIFYNNAVMHSVGDNNPALRIDNSDSVGIYWARMESNGTSAPAVAYYGSCNDTYMLSPYLHAQGASSDAFFSTGEINGELYNIHCSYTHDMINIDSGDLNVVNSNVQESDVEIISATLSVYFYRQVYVVDESDNAVEGVDLKLENDHDGVVYATSHFGGADPIDTEYFFPFVTMIFQGPNMDYGENTFSVYYDGGEELFDKTISNVDANTTECFVIILPGFSYFEDAVNVSAQTISSTQIDLSFDASPGVDVYCYYLWIDSGSGFDVGTIKFESGTFPYRDLMPSKEYRFKVIAMDVKDRKSIGVVVSNTTLSCNEDHISGHVVYTGGPLDGQNVTNATAFLYNETMVEIANATVNSTTGRYLMEGVLFGFNYTLKVVPRDAVENGGMESGYIINMTAPFNHAGELVMNFSIDHYSYTLPPPMEGTISGAVIYNGGPLDGQNATNATAFLYNETMVEIANATVNSTTGR
ncbi:MAG: hypothetical protein U9R75_10895, partial [Candidatus Thermoplasmatota archaeon]|nr:hypothetical protein [Candidatus Thermoplasmatota archaeon]